MNRNTVGYVFKRAQLGCATGFIAVVGILGFLLRGGSGRRADECRENRGRYPR